LEGLKNLEIPNSARSDELDDDGNPIPIVDIFENKALGSSVRHDRISGFWDINWLGQVKNGLEKFLIKGNMRLLIGVPIKNSLKKLLNADEQVREAGKELLERLGESPILNKWENFDILLWMLKQERLEVKILLMGHGKSHPKPEHAKIQIYEDSFGNRIGSSGSKNDTFRGNQGGVDFVVISKSWASQENVQQIEGMQHYFEDHWKHSDAKSLEEIHKDDSFRSELENLAQKEDINLKPHFKWIREIGRIPEDAKGVIVETTGSKVDKKMFNDYDIFKLKLPKDLPLSAIRSILDQRPDLKIFIASTRNILSDELPISPGIWAHSWKVKGWNYSDERRTIPNISTDNLEAVVYKFLGYIQIESKPKEQPTEDNLVPETTEEDNEDNTENGEDIVWNPKYFNKPKYPLRECQIEGVKHWLEHPGCLLEHATGSGKTLTGQMIASRMFEECDVVIITTPFIDIANQWEDDVKRNFNQDLVHIACLHSRKLTPINKSIFEIYESIEKGMKVIIITVNPTLVKNWNRIDTMGIFQNFSIIYDEAHRWSSANKIEFIESNIYPYMKNSLSITAKLHSVGNGSERQQKMLQNNMPKHVFSLRQAIKTRPRILSDYRYIINTIEIDPELELKDAKEIFEELATSECIGNIVSTDIIPTIVYTKTVSDIDEDDAEGKINSDENMGAQAVARRITDESKTSGSNKNVHAQSYIGLHGSDEKLNKKKQYESGNIHCLVAVRCLDEGVDIPTIKRLYLVHGALSDRRQWIQRRGRALRLNRDENGNILDKDSIAIIHDYYPIPVVNFDSNSVCRETVEWMKSQIGKIRELALNSKENTSDYDKYLNHIHRLG